jgi:hypothetical protein
MKIQIANSVTGEVVECRTDFFGMVFSPSFVMKKIRGQIREWMKAGLKINDFEVLYAPTFEMKKYIREYAWGLMKNECDVCHAPKLNKELNWCEDSAGVCIMVICADGCPTHKKSHNDWMWEIGENCK